MKLAVFITGHFRDALKTKENYAQFLESEHDVDFYVGTWSNYDVHREEWKIIEEQVEVERICKELFGDKLKGLWIGDAKKYEAGEPPAPGSPPRTLWESHCRQDLKDALKTAPVFKPGDYPGLHYYFYWMQRLLDQYYVMREIYSVYQRNKTEEYDVLLRIRGDMNFVGKPRIPIEENSDGIHVNGYVWQEYGTHDSTGLMPWGISDQIAWGKPHWMRKYFSYANHYCEIFGPLIEPESCFPRWNGTVYPTNAFYSDANHMLAYYLLRYPYYKQLRPNDIHDHDLILHKHGHAHTDVRTPTGVVISYDYYDIMSRGRYG
jgi:hypothetical protein